MTSNKTPQDVLDAIQKLDSSDQVKVKTYIAKLKAIIDEKETEILQLKENDDHAHFHGHEKCTADHSHDHKGHGAGETHDHSHKHSDDDIPEWKKKAMDSDPNAAPFGGSWNTEASVDATKDKEVDFPPIYESGEDFEKAGEHKMKASELKSEGKWEEALEEYTQAIQAAPPSALLYANRATALLQLERYQAAERDCDEALKENPDSAKALRVRGKVRKHMGKWEEARHDLSDAQAIDFDEGTVEDLKEVSKKMQEIEKERVQEKLKHEEKLRKRAEEIKKAQEEAKRESARSSSSSASGMGGMPGGMPGGMGGSMPGGMGGSMGGMGGIMEILMSDPELAAAMQNPKVTAALSSVMGAGGAPDPAKMQELMQDPEVGPVLNKLMTKLGAAMGGGGMGGAGGMGAGMGGSGGGDDDDIPDLDGDDDDFDDMPDLE